MKLAILDLYDGTPNQGMRCIKDMVARYEGDLEDWKVFDVRGKNEVPDLSYDIFISTGGPGNPLEGDGVWDKNYYNWLDSVWSWNQKNPEDKKHVFFICHSFQMMVNHFNLAKITKRYSKSFGTFPVHKAAKGIDDPLFKELPEPFYIADFRDFQAVEANEERFTEIGAKIIALEKYRPHVALERAIMGIRLSDEIVGVQFHPEADPDGMLLHFSSKKQEQHIKENYGVEKYDDMIEHLNDEDKINLTHDTILPTFLENAIKTIVAAKSVMA
ncbi:MAG: type 1 glutamine amidotransferase [Saprospiraceae bacterium]